MFKKSENAPLEKAKAMLKILLRAVIRNNPKYQVAVALFCDTVGQGPDDAIMGLIEKELGNMDDQMLAKDIRDALIVIGMPDFDSIEQLEVLKTLCGLAR